MVWPFASMISVPLSMLASSGETSVLAAPGLQVVMTEVTVTKSNAESRVLLLQSAASDRRLPTPAVEVYAAVTLYAAVILYTAVELYAAVILCVALLLVGGELGGDGSHQGGGGDRGVSATANSIVSPSPLNPARPCSCDWMAASTLGSSCAPEDAPKVCTSVTM